MRNCNACLQKRAAIKPLSYTKRIQWRIRGIRLLMAAMVGYMLLLVALGGGDSRIMTRTADMVSDLLFFGGLIFLGIRLHRNKKLLRDRQLLQEERLREEDERERWLHDRSGGTVVDILLAVMMCAVFTAALFNMAAFYTAFALLLLTILLKFAAYRLASRAPLFERKDSDD